MTKKLASKGIIWAVVLCIGITVCISSITTVQGARVVGGIKAGSYFRWDFNYTGTEDVGSSAVGFQHIDWFSLTVSSETFSNFNLNYTDSQYRIQTPVIDPEDALSMLPLGTSASHSTALTLTVADVIAPISMITVNWADQLEYYVTDPTITTIVNRNATHHTKYPFKGAWVDAYIFQGEVAQTHFGEDLNGYFRLVYSAKHGFMIEYEVYLESISSSDIMAFTAILSESNMEIGYSFFQNFLVGFCASFGFQWIYSLILLGIIWGRRRYMAIDYGKVVEDKEKLDETEGLPESDEEGKIIPPPQDLPEDYNFIDECPFCGKKHEKYEDVCPECGGKR